MRARILPHSLQGRLLLTFLTLNLLAIGGLVAWEAQGIEADTLEQAEHELEIKSHLIADALRPAVEDAQGGVVGSADALSSQVQSYASKNGVSIAVIDSNLRQVHDSSGGSSAGQTVKTAEILAAQAGTEQHDIRRDPASGAERLYVGTAIQNRAGAIVGYVQTSIPTAPIYADIRQSQFTLFGAGAVMLLLTALASLLVARQIARPVSSLTVASEALAAGHLDQRVTPGGPDETRRLGSAFNRMADRMRETLARQQEFTANAAHELRSPLTSIRLRLEMLQRSGRAHPELMERYLDQMDRELGYLQGLVEDMLTLSALAGHDGEVKELLDLAPLLRELAEAMMPQVEQAGLELIVDTPPALPPARLDRDQLRTVFRNLLDNAIKYSSSGGRITIQAESGAGDLCISVADTGPGIPPESLPRIFDRFYRAETSRAERRGSGLGLALVQSLVSANGGRIQVESQIGKGTVFTVHFPLAGA